MTDQPAPPPALAPGPLLTRFGPDAIDRAINMQLQHAIPGDERTAILDVKLTSTNADGGAPERVLTGVVAANLGHGWGLALGGGIDPDDREDYQVEVLVRKSW